MKAICYTRYGPPEVMRLEEVAKPVPADDEVLVKVHAASVNAADWRLMRADPHLVRLVIGLLKPKFNILGADVAGTVEAVGRNIKQFRPGDAVYGDLSHYKWGGFAEYVCATEQFLAPMPANLAFDEAAALPLAGITALQAIRDSGRVQAGHNVLVHGASGGVGTLAVQIAKALGANVTAVCSTRNVARVQLLGADRAIDYTREDFARDEQRYDLILAINGDRSIFDYRRALKPAGVYVMIGGSSRQMFQTLLFGSLLSRRGGQKLQHQTTIPNQPDLLAIKAMVEAGTLKPVVDRRFPLSETPQALHYVEQGHAPGKVVIVTTSD